MSTVAAMPTALDLRIDRGLSGLRRPAVRAALVDAITEATDALDSGRVEVVVLAARRMLCLYSALRDLGVPAPSRGMIVSDRFLEILPDGAWAGKRVLLVDDTTITGATLADRSRTIRRLVGPDGTFEPALVVLDPPASAETPIERRDWLHDLTGGDLHAQTAAVFGRTLTPYFTDFAVSATVDRPAGDLFTLLTSGGWQVAEVTSAAIAGTGARSFSLFPDTATQSRIAAGLGDAAAAVEVAKIRVLSRQEGERVALRIVPIVLIKEFRRSEIERVLETIGGRRSDTACEQLAGVITYDLSRRLLDAVSDSFADATGPIEEDTAHRDLVLGASVRLLGGDWVWTDLVAADAVAPQESTVIDGRGPLIVGDGDVADLMAWFESLADGEPTMVERERWSLQDLAARQRRSTKDLSVALDIGNDLGTVVPSHLVSEDRVRRAYRPGESNDRTRDVSENRPRWASVSTTIRLDDRLRPLVGSEPGATRDAES